MNSIKSMSFSIILLTNLLLISTSYAEEKSSSQDSDEILTQSELSQCNKKTQFLAQTAKQLHENSRQFETQKNEISQLENDRSQLSAELDFHSQADVEQYNLINDQLEQLSQSYSADVEHFNRAVKQYKANIKQHISECDDKEYYKK